MEYSDITLITLICFAISVLIIYTIHFCKEEKRINTMKRIHIYSHWGVLNSQLDGIYLIDYEGDIDIKQEIKKAYEEMAEKHLDNGSLQKVLDYMKANGIFIVYAIMKFEKYNCIYGEFEKE